MSKMKLYFSKLSFSLILALFLVGMLSTAAFARDPYGLKPYQGTGNTLVVPFAGNSADSADVAGKAFTLQLKDSSGKVVKTFTATLDSSKKGSVTIPASDITPGTVYTVELFHSGSSTLLSSSTAVVTDGHNTFSQPALDTKGTGLFNANQTGYNNTRKQRTGQKVHGFYTNNTNSCASCHQTHTAADNNLLMKDGAYSTCASCHDGTMGAKNVWESISSSTIDGIAGTFNYTLGHNSSIHEADGSLKVSAAPGGNKTADSSSAQWGQQFDCASCHAPHGNGSGSENNLNFNPLGWGTVAYTDTNPNGKLFKDLTPYNTVPTTESTPYIVVKATGVTQSAIDANFWWKRANVTAGSTVLQTYRWDGKKYVADYSLWLQEKGYPYKADSVLKDKSGTDITRTSGVKVVWRDGFAWGSNVSNITSATIALGIDVETSENIRSLYDSNYTGYIPDSGTEMSKYCSACHTDYLSATRSNVTGVYTDAHRHQTATDRLTCVRCHYGHGTDAQLMKDANDNTYYTLTANGGKYAGDSAAALDYLKDPNPSSALKRYTGMSVCYGCHGKGSAFMNNPNNVDTPMGGDPGTPRSSVYSSSH